MPSNPILNQRVWVFDFDGTLVDSMGTLTKLGGQVLAQFYGVTPTKGEALYRGTSGLPFAQQVEKLFPAHANNAAAVETFEGFKHDYHAWAQPFPDSLDTLVTLKRRGAFLAISSNNFETIVARTVAALCLPVDLVCGWHDGHGKGAAHFDRIRHAAECTNPDMIFVGDSLHDGVIAAEHAIHFAGRSGTFTADAFTARFPGIRVVPSLMELV